MYINNIRQPYSANIISFANKPKNKKNESKPFPLSEKYGINPQNVFVVSEANVRISDAEKQELIEKLLEAHELALKNYNYGNISKSGFATNIGLTNGNWHLATNFNNTRNDISAICGERSAVLGAYNDLLKQSPIITPQDKPALDFKVKYLAMSTYKEPGTDTNSASPCAECLSWLNTTRYFDDDTVIASLEKDNNTGIFQLRLSKISQYLPLRNEVNYADDIDVDTMPVKLTKEALEAAKQKGITEQEIKDMVTKTVQAYKKNNLTGISNHNIAASIMSAGRIYTAAKIDFSKRWYIDPVLFATGKAIEETGENTSIDAICYVGNSKVTDQYGFTHNDGVVNLKTLGALNTKYAKADSLIITTTNDSINVRTIENYMPDRFKFIQKYAIK